MRMSRIRVCVRYEGRVQGVGFRANAFRIAERHEVDGWVRNESDGAVTLVVEGLPEEVESVLADIARSMKGFIRSADRREGPAEGERGFEVRR